MPKLKTHKGVTKRMKIRRSGKVTFKRSCAGHLMSGKSGKRCRHLRRPGVAPAVVAAKIRKVAGS